MLASTEQLIMGTPRGINHTIYDKVKAAIARGIVTHRGIADECNIANQTAGKYTNLAVAEGLMPVQNNRGRRRGVKNKKPMNKSAVIATRQVTMKAADGQLPKTLPPTSVFDLARTL